MYIPMHILLVAGCSVNGEGERGRASHVTVAMYYMQLHLFLITLTFNLLNLSRPPPKFRESSVQLA